MKPELIKSDKIYVKKSPAHNYGVFCNSDIKKGEIVEECYYILPDQSGWQHLDPNFMRYFYSIPYVQEECESFCKEKGYASFFYVTRPVCVLGYGMIFNHSKTPNLKWEPSPVGDFITYKASKNIEAGEELFVMYNDTLDFENEKQLA